MTLATINSIMVILFLRLFNFFLTYRQNRTSKMTIKLTFLNKFIIFWVYFLTALCVWNIGSLLVDGLAKFYYGVNYRQSSVTLYYLSPVYRIVFPFKDLLIALSFASLYYYQGMKKRRESVNGSEA